MSLHEPSDDCPNELLNEAIEVIRRDDNAGLDQLDSLLKSYPADSRLHFLRGSLLAGLRRYDDARQAMRAAVRITPDFWVARFQLGFLELTSGEAAAAAATWAPLEELAADHYLRLFASGLQHLARDEFAECVAELRDGMARNHENPQMNADMQLVLDNIPEDAGVTPPAPDAEEPTSSAAMLLQQYAAKPTRH